MYCLPFQKQSFHKSELVGLQRMGGSQLPFHRLTRLMPTNPLPYCSPKKTNTKFELLIHSEENEVIDNFKMIFKHMKNNLKAITIEDGIKNEQNV